MNVPAYFCVVRISSACSSDEKRVDKLDRDGLRFFLAILDDFIFQEFSDVDEYSIA